MKAAERVMVLRPMFICSECKSYVARDDSFCADCGATLIRTIVYPR